MRLGPLLLVGGAILATLFVFLVPDWRLPGKGRELYDRAASQVQFAPTAVEFAAQNPKLPALPPVADDPRPAAAVFKNLKVLTALNAGDFLRSQYAITAWVAPTQGCGFCHAGNDFASDANPRKEAARTMLAMTRHINATWKGHVGAQGVTCFSCHRGQPVPSEVWYQSPPRTQAAMIDKQDDWNEASRTVRGFFPNQGYEEYLLASTPAHGQALTALPTGTAPSFVESKRLYEAMMQMSEGMGVNCGYCHQSRNFADWSQSTPARWIGESGLQLTRDLNRNYLLKLAQQNPQTRWQSGNARPISLPARLSGAQPGAALADCATCHHGTPKPFTMVGPDVARRTERSGCGPSPTAHLREGGDLDTGREGRMRRTAGVQGRGPRLRGEERAVRGTERC